MQRPGVLALGLLMLSVCFSFASSASERPNVVIIVADDLGYADPSYRGSQIETPTIDKLAEEGLVLERFYTAPICSPTRAALLTGRDPMRLGLAYSVLLPWDNGGIHPSEKLMPESFRDAGYQTALVGKWHLGHSQQHFTPQARGFDDFYGHLHTEVGFFPPFGAVGGKDFQHNGKSIDDDGYETFLLADYASEWIKQRDKSRPFFLYLPFLAPHEPLAAPQDLIDKYAHLKDERGDPRSKSGGDELITRMAPAVNKKPVYAAVVDAMDQAMGKVINTLEDEGIKDNTIVLFFSDNGASRMRTQGAGDNAPLRGGKAETYEGGIRVVSSITWPEKIKPGVSKQTMTVMDVFPTLAAAAQVPPNNRFQLDGLNMLPLLTDGVDVQRDQLIFFASEIPTYGSFNFTAIDGDWKLVQWVEQDLVSTEVRNELYNVADDLGEYNNLAQKYPERTADLAAKILKWRALHPINGVRARLAPPPGWKAPEDWANYPRSPDQLQKTPVSSIAPSKFSEYILDMRLQQRGRLIYNCIPSRWLGGMCTNTLVDDDEQQN